MDIYRSGEGGTSDLPRLPLDPPLVKSKKGDAQIEHILTIIRIESVHLSLATTRSRYGATGKNN